MISGDCRCWVNDMVWFSVQLRQCLYQSTLHAYLAFLSVFPYLYHILSAPNTHLSFHLILLILYVPPQLPLIGTLAPFSCLLSRFRTGIHSLFESYFPCYSGKVYISTERKRKNEKRVPMRVRVTSPSLENTNVYG